MSIASLYKVHEDAKDKDMEIEMSWICPESKNRHAQVPKEILAEAEAYAKQQMEQEIEE